MVGIAFSTAALIIVLSVFNGLEDLLRSLYASFDPEIKIEAAEGKSFEISADLTSKIKSVTGVEIVTEVIEDFAYVRYRDADMVVTMKGVSDNFIDQHRLDDRIDEGQLKLKENGVDFAIIGRGIKYSLSVAVEDDLNALQVFYIKNRKSSSLDPLSKRKRVDLALLILSESRDIQHIDSVAIRIQDRQSTTQARIDTEDAHYFCFGRFSFWPLR